MALRITLKPEEGILINGAWIRNANTHHDVPRPTTIVIETQCRFLRESEIMREGDADTAAKRLLVTLQAIYLCEPTMRHVFQPVLLVQSRELVEAAPSAAPYVAAIAEMLASDQHHRAIKHGRQLVAHEAGLMELARKAA